MNKAQAPHWMSLGFVVAVLINTAVVVGATLKIKSLFASFILLCAFIFVLFFAIVGLIQWCNDWFRDHE